MGLRGPKPQGEKDWYKRVAELMINEFMSFSSACMAVGQKFTSSQDEHVHEHSEAFRNLLTGMHLDYFVEVGTNSSIGKEYVKGVAVTAIRKLGESDQWDKVGVPLKQLSDVLGLTKDTGDKPVLANLTQADIDKIRLELKEKAEAEKAEQKASESKTIVVVLGDKPN